MKLFEINTLSNTFNFNPSIGHITRDIYLISNRNVRNDNSIKPLDTNPVLDNNIDHPWKTNWSSKIDNTSLHLFTINNNKVKLLQHPDYPFILAFLQDLRIFELWSDNNYATFILSFNQVFLDENLVLGSGYECSKRCFIINTGFLVINKHTLKPVFVPSKEPLCLNLSNPVEKNWSFWKYNNDILFSYNLTPEHKAFNVDIKDISDGELLISDKCRLLTVNSTNTNFLKQLEQYYDKKVIISLSTPSYKIGKEYYSVGHIKITLKYLQYTDKPQLKNFYEKNVKGNSKYLHEQYVYLMFFYKFNVSTVTITNEIEINSDKHEAITYDAITADITGVSYCYVFNTTQYNYLLNFPSGLCVHNNTVYITFGEADKSCHLLSMNIKEFKDLIKPVSKLYPSRYKFIVKNV